jgi:3-deoxy-manno-octulosonate cytidylyltransferase (CMP-KDO synthetase)
MIQRVWEAASACKSAAGIVVATDDTRIAEHVSSFGKAILTAAEHPSGTDRCREAYEKSGMEADVVVNIQGDEPFIKPEQVQLLVEMFNNPDVQIATLMKEIFEVSDIEDPNIVKVVCDSRGKALYFSRSRIPYLRDRNETVRYFRHLGMYAYRAGVLKAITQLKPSMLEETEKLEQLRWLENGFHIAVAETHWQSPAVDTPEDLEKARRFLL